MRSVLELLSEMNIALALVVGSRMQDAHKAMLKTEMQKLLCEVSDRPCRLLPWNVSSDKSW